LSQTSRNLQGLSGEEMLPRFRELGDLTLDLFHRDGRIDDRWVGFHPREFEMLWRLSDRPGEVLSRRRLLAEVWRIHHEPETNSVAVHVSRIRAKLEPFGLAHILRTHAKGGYYLDLGPLESVLRFRRNQQS